VQYANLSDYKKLQGSLAHKSNALRLNLHHIVQSRKT